MKLENCVYRFLNKENEVIYVGKAKNLLFRLSNHTHLSEECYSEIENIEYTTFESENDIELAEIYYISKYKPKYNKVYSTKDIKTELIEFDDKIWNPVPNECVLKCKDEVKHIKNRPIPIYLTKEEQQKLLDVFNTRYFYPTRNKVMIELFLCTGLKVSEMINLKWKDIDLMTGQLKVVQDKNSNDRTLRIGDEMLEELQMWRTKEFKRFGKCELVFCTSSKKPIATNDVRDMLLTYSKKAKITKRVTPDKLRHTFATELLIETKDIRLVQKALGHSDISTTMIYTHIVDDELEDALKNFKKKL